MSRPSRFEGKIGRTLADSEPWFDEAPHPAEGAPNVVLILLDDTGFAQLGCFGSDIDTNNIDALAADGLQFTNFHVTPLCSPTRAALLTGRSSHAVGMRSVSNFRTGFPHMLGHMTNHAATIAEVLRDDGYTTFCLGKWHLAPMEQCSAAGPFDQWPLGRGFDRFYGFLEGETDQFHPDLVCDNHPIDPPARAEDGYHLSEDLVDQGLKMIADATGVRPDRPFFTYLAFGATHAPHQAPDPYLQKYRGTFDAGWDDARERWFKRQIELGVIPPQTVLADRNPGVDAWDDLPEDQQRLGARLQEAFAAFLDHTDDQIGRLVDGLRSMGQLDNTILMVMADNGASQEGGPFGVMHEMKFFNGILETPSEAINRIDDIGGPHSHTNYPWGWAQAGNTPFRWYKQNTHEGGVHVPMVMHWPDGVAAEQQGTKRNQFVYISDVTPTVYDLLGIEPPEVYRGVQQLPVAGSSFASVLESASAAATNTEQLFEMFGSRAMVSGDWKAVCKHQPGADFETEVWELYNLADDPSECNDLATDQPDRLTDLVALWWLEAERDGVLPLDDRTIELFGARFREGSPHPTNRRYVYRPPSSGGTNLGLPMSPIPAQAGAQIGGRSFDLRATVTYEPGNEGVLWATGTENSGISVFVQDGRLVLDYNAFDDHSVLVSDVSLDAGSADSAVLDLCVRFRRGDGFAGSAELAVGGVASGSVEIPLYMRMISSVGSSIGYDHGSAISTRYQAPFPYSGRLDQIEIQLVSAKDAAGQAAVRAAEAAAEMARQ